MERVWEGYKRSFTMPMFHMIGESSGPDLDEFMEFLFVTGELDDNEDSNEELEEEDD